MRLAPPHHQDIAAPHLQDFCPVGPGESPDHEIGGVAEAGGNDGLGKVVLVAILMKVHFRTRLAEVDKAGLRDKVRSPALRRNHLY